jgi:hypothetical protein
MHRVDIERANDWTSLTPQNPIGSRMKPRSIDTQCGYCGRLGALMCGKEVTFNAETSTLTLKARCTGNDCNKNSTVLIIDAVTEADYNSGMRSKEIWILPKPIIKSSIFEGFEDSIPTRIFKAYTIAIKSFNLGLWGGCITECGRAVEGITRDKFPPSITKDKNDKELALGPKFDRLKAKLASLDEGEQLFGPILQLGNSVRLGRNTSAHFDVEKDPAQEDAVLVLELAEYLISYFYIIPKKADALEDAINALVPADAEEQGEPDGIAV